MKRMMVYLNDLQYADIAKVAKDLEIPFAKRSVALLMTVFRPRQTANPFRHAKDLCRNLKGVVTPMIDPLTLSCFNSVSAFS